MILPLDALAEKIKRHCVQRENGCIEWQRARNDKGYGQVWNGEGLSYTHRIMCEFAHGPMPPKWEVDHLCRNPKCCNPEHLEPVEHCENTRRGLSGLRNTERAVERTHCPHGHLLDQANTLVSRPEAPFRQCRACARRRQKERYRKLRADGLAYRKVGGKYQWVPSHSG